MFTISKLIITLTLLSMHRSRW